jgi:hypothetical protein
VSPKYVYEEVADPIFGNQKEVPRRIEEKERYMRQLANDIVALSSLQDAP